MMVMGSLLILTTIAVEFAYNSHISYQLASSERDRLKAYYLARSAFNLVRLQIRYEKDIRARYAGLLKNFSGNNGVSSDPLCKQIPLSTELLKGITSGALLGDQEDKKGTQEGEDKKKGPVLDKSAIAGKIEDSKFAVGAEDFLSFSGDFQASCDTEERKINLNIFRNDPISAGTTTTATTDSPLSVYDVQKALLFSLMSQKDFEPIFKGKPDMIRKVVNAIADWADRDDRINEAPGVSGSAEDSLYTDPKYHYKVKNGKYTSVEELLLVAGVGDAVYQKLEPEVTVYGDNKINLCQASQEMVKAFIIKTAQTTPGLPLINPDDTSRWASIFLAIKTACNDPLPQVGTIAAAVSMALQAQAIPGLANLLTTTSRFYRIETTGAVGDSHVRLTAVLDSAQKDPKLWKTVYFREE